MPRLITLTNAILKEILREYQLETTGTKAELVARIAKHTESDEIDEATLEQIVPTPTSSLQAQINALAETIKTLAQTVEASNLRKDDKNTVSANNNNINRATIEQYDNVPNAASVFNQESRMTTPHYNVADIVDASDHQPRCYSVREIVESIPDFDPTRDTSLSVEQFVERVENTKRVYQWNEKTLLLAVCNRMKGAAKLWLDCLPELHSTWQEFADALIDEFGSTPHEAEIHYKMCNASRKCNENITDYCFRVCALGRRYKLSDQAIIKYTRDGVQHRDLQTATAALKFNTTKEIRECFEEYSRNLPEKRNARENEEHLDKNKSKTQQTQPNKVQCYNCSEFGHISSRCSKPPRRIRCKDCGKVHAKGQPENCGKSTSVKQVKKSEHFETQVKIFDNTYSGYYDTGSECHLIKKSIATQLPIDPMPCLVNLSGMWGGNSVAREKIELLTLISGIEMKLPFYVVEDDVLSSDILLGRDIFLDQNVKAEINEGQVTLCRRTSATTVNSNKSIARNEIKPPIGLNDLEVGTENKQDLIRLVSILNKFRNVFPDSMRDIGKTDIIEMNIVVDPTQIISHKPYRIPEPKKQIVKEMIDELLENDIIQSSTSNYSSPMLLVKKKNGTDRLCIDYRHLNKYTKNEIFPTPNVEECLQDAKRYKYFISLDMNSGFYQIPVSEMSRKFTAFITIYGLYEFKRMPFGLKNAPATFQRLMQRIREKLPDGLIIYMDDILVGGITVDEVLEKLEIVLQVLKDANLTLNLKKCYFLTKTIDFLGHKITVEGIEPGLAKTECVRKFPQPTNVTEVRRFLGLSGYFRKFVPRYAQLSEPLRKLLQKDQPFEWTDDQTLAFEALKTSLTSHPVLVGFDVSANHEIHTDASASGLAGVLMQNEKGTLKPVAYYSRSTTENERKFHSYELEALAVVETLERFRYYIYGKAIKVVTDCSAITALTKQKEIIPRIARWWLKIQDFNVEFEHRAGDRMGHVDALSRATTMCPRETDVADMRIAKVNINNEDWVLSLQLQDTKLQEIVGNVKKNIAEFTKHYELKDERLYRKFKGKLLWVVPKSMRWNVVHDCHNNAGHLGVEKTMSRLSENLWFARMRNFVKSYIKSCVDCAYNKTQGGKKGCEYHYSDIEPIPFKCVHLDHLGPFPKSSKRNEHVLVLVDAFTKFVMIKAVRNTSTRFVLEALNEISSYFGLPERIVSDRGTAFTSREFQRYCDTNDIIHQRNAVRTPRANGQAERVNRTILSMLTTMTAEDKAWDSQLRSIQWSLNSMKNSSTNKSALQLLYNFTPRDVLKNKLILALHDYQLVSEEELNNRREEAAKYANQKRAKAKVRFDKAHGKPVRFNLGDLVLVESEQTSIGHSRKLEPRYKGPFVVTKDLGRDRYVVEDLPKSRRTKRSYTSIFSSDKMKKWCQLPDDEENDPDDPYSDTTTDDEDVHQDQDGRTEKS